MSDFSKLYQHTIDRFNYGGVQASDYVKITSTDIEGVNVDYKNELERFKEEDLNLRVFEIVKQGSNRGHPATFSAVVGQEMAGGLCPNKMTIPVSHLEVVTYNHAPSIPDSWKVENKSDLDGEPEILDAKKTDSDNNTDK